MVEWVGRNPRPPTAHSQGVRMYKANKPNINVLAYEYQYDQGRASLAGAYRVRKLQEIISKNVQETKDEPDIDKMDL